MWLAFVLVGCGKRTPPPPLPTAIPISLASGEVVATEDTGGTWVLLSGVDEHGLVAEHEVALLLEPDPAADAGTYHHTGIAAAVQEIRHTGPQNLRRFYRVQLMTGEAGWISDYYVRHLAYLFDKNGQTVALYASPDGVAVGEVANVTPVVVRDPSDVDWWLVQTVESGLVGWVSVRMIKESPEPEFLLEQDHVHR